MDNFIRQDEVNIGRYLPKFLQNDERFNSDLMALSEEQERMRLQLMDIFNQFYVETATWGLNRWESVLGLESNSALTYEQRRSAILLKLQSKKTSTYDFMLELVRRYYAADAEATIEEVNARYLLNIIAERTPFDIAGLRSAIETYKPAHLAYLIIYLVHGSTTIYTGIYIQQHKVINIGMATNIGTSTISDAVKILGVVRTYKTIKLVGDN